MPFFAACCLARLIIKSAEVFIPGYARSFCSKTSSNPQYLLFSAERKENEIIIRREISSSGKSRAFINDTPVRLDQLKDL